MEELKPEELEQLVQELQGESQEEEALSPEVERLLRDLQPARLFTSRLRAARQLGGLDSSSRQIVQALATVAEMDDSDEVRAMAAQSLRAPVHHEYLKEHLDQKRAAETTHQQRPITDRRVPQAEERAGRRMPEQKSRIPVQCLKAGSVVGVMVGLAIGIWFSYAPEPGSPAGVMVIALTVGAVLGAIAGAIQGGEGRGLKDRITGAVVGAIAAAVVATLCGGPLPLPLGSVVSFPNSGPCQDALE